MRLKDQHWKLERSDIPITNDIFAQQFVGSFPEHIRKVFGLLYNDRHSFAVFWPTSYIKPDPKSKEELAIWVREVAGGGILNKYCRHPAHVVEEIAIREGTRLPTTINPEDCR